MAVRRLLSGQVTRPILPPPIPAASRELQDPPRFAFPATDPATGTTLHWEAAGGNMRLIAHHAATPPCGTDLGIYPPAARAHLHALLRARCQEGSRPAAGGRRPWIYHAGGAMLRPPGQAGVWCFVQADGWVSLIAETWPGQTTNGHPLGRYPLWEVLHWLGTPPVPPPADEDTSFLLPTPLEQEIRAVSAWWMELACVPPDAAADRPLLTPAQAMAFEQALGAEIQAHLVGGGWDAARPEWRAAERALGLHEDPDPVLTRAAFTSGLWETLVPIWSKHRAAVRIWINPGQVRVALGEQPPQILWPPTSVAADS